MPKRKQTGAQAALETPSKRPRRQPTNTREPNDQAQQSALNSLSTPEKKIGFPHKHRITPASGPDRSGNERPNGKTLFATPRKAAKRTTETPSKKRADQSAKRKSASLLAARLSEDDWDGGNALAEAILEAEDVDGPPIEGEGQAADSTTLATPKRGRGRPKGSRNRRSPTPEGDIAPEERYFFQNRTGPSHISDNVFSSVKLLTHDEYFEQARMAKDGHTVEKEYLMKLHRRSFSQWKLEMNEGYSICLYGYGSKRLLTTRFAEWLHARSKPAPRVVIVNGYTAKLTIRSILNTIASIVVANDESLKLSGQPQEMLDALLAYLSRHPTLQPIVVMVNSIDAAPLSKNGVQDILARLASHDHVHIIVTADTPFFPLLWNSSYLDLFNFAFHDCTTFTPYDAELPVVDEVYDLLGRKGRRMGGKEGIKYVLKSLPPNAQNLYQILLGEILSILVDDKGGNAEEEDGEEGGGGEEANGNDGAPKRARHGADEEVGIEYRLLYQKASEEFVASSDMNFRFLLKEFHDHQMITSRRDASGAELLCVPLGREEMQAVLEDLVIS
ncbi:hypothetical protein DV736_g1748, partial [Chaetothyriales sp. CBS 134916]